MADPIVHVKKVDSEGPSIEEDPVGHVKVADAVNIHVIKVVSSEVTEGSLLIHVIKVESISHVMNEISK